MIAIIQTGGKQYLLTPNTTLDIEKISGDATAPATFDTVLLVADESGSSVTIGTPTVHARIAATIEKQFRTRKIMVRKFKSKIRYHRTAGHRQHKTRVRVASIA